MERMRDPCLAVVAGVGVGQDDLAVDDREAVVVGRAAVDPESASDGVHLLRYCSDENHRFLYCAVVSATGSRIPCFYLSKPSRMVVQFAKQRFVCSQGGTGNVEPCS